MKKAMVSIEFMIVFIVALFVFLAASWVMVTQFGKISSTKELALNLAKEIKVQLITASLSDGDFSSNITIPAIINKDRIKLSLSGKPDNMLRIFKLPENELIVTEFLPVLDEVPEDINNKLIIKKTVADNKIKISSE